MRKRPRSSATRTALACALLLLSVAAGGCHVHTHRVGGGPTGIGADSQRQFYVFFGLVRLNEVNVQRLAADLSSYEIRSESTLVDFVLAPLLLPLTVTSRTVTVYR